MIKKIGIKKLIKYLSVALLLAGTSFLIGFFVKYHLPKIKTRVLIEIEAYTRENSPVRVWPQDVEFTLFPLGVKLKEVRVLPKEELKDSLGSFTIDYVQVGVSIIPLFRGQLRIGSLELRGSDISFVHTHSNGHEDGLPDIDLDFIHNLPIELFKITSFKAHIESHPLDLVFQLADFNLQLENRQKSLRLGIQSDNTIVKKASDASILDFDIETQLSLDRDGVYVSGFSIRRHESYIVGSGELVGSINDLEFQEVRTRVRSQLRLHELSTVVKSFMGQSEFPVLSGSSEFEMDLTYGFTEDVQPQLSFSGITESLSINDFFLGKAQAQAQIEDEKLVFEKLNILNPGGLVELKPKASLGIKRPYALNGSIQFSDVNLHKLLGSLRVNNVPTYTNFQGQVRCQGELVPIQVQCSEVDVYSEKLKVTQGLESEPVIIELEDLNTKGSFRLDSKEFQYQAELRLGESSNGTSSGTVIYDKGFEIKYEAPALDFSDVKNLANLKIEGLTQITGKTQGDASAATMDLTLEGQNAWLEDFALGNIKMRTQYDKGKLSFTKIEATQGTTQYSGDVVIDLPNSQLDVNLDAPFVDIEDLAYVFSRHFDIPIDFSGTGSIKARVRGPLRLNALSYEVSSSFFRGTLAGESYDQAVINLMSKQGDMEIQRAVLSKGPSQINAKGGISSQGELSIGLSGKNFLIDQSEFFSKLKMNLTGLLNFNADLRGPITDPTIRLSGKASSLVIGGEPAEDSEFEVNMSPQEVTGKFNFIGNTINMDILWPFSEKNPFHFSLKINDWNFSPLFGALTDSVRASEYESLVSGEIELYGTERTFQGTSGLMSFDKLMVKNGPSFLINQKPIDIQVQNGVIDVRSFNLAGANNHLNLKSNQRQPGIFDLALDGRVDLVLGSIVTPFLEDLRGQVNLALELKGPPQDPEILGSAFVQGGHGRLRGFPHAFEQVQLDTLFSKRKILINSLRGRLAGGLIAANGSILINSLTDVPIDIRGTFQDSTFQVPEGFSMRGSGDLAISGDWFPYTLSINFNVDSGSIERQLAAQARGQREVRPSPFLPQALAEKRFSPVNLDINVITRNDIRISMQVPQVDIRSQVSGQTRVHGPPEAVRLRGRFNITPGSQVIIRSNAFEIREGFVEYHDSVPENPSLNLTAESRVLSRVGEEEIFYDVTMRVTGTAQRPNIAMSSEPPLAERDLLSLLTLGFISQVADDDPTQPTLGARATDTGYQIGSALLSQQLGLSRQVEERIGVEFDYQSSYSTEDEAAVHRFQLRKQWTPRFGTSASRSIGKTNVNNFRAEYKLNRNLSVVGQWEGREQTGASADSAIPDTQLNQFGVDVEYRVDFR